MLAFHADSRHCIAKILAVERRNLFISFYVRDSQRSIGDYLNPLTSKNFNYLHYLLEQQSSSIHLAVLHTDTFRTRQTLLNVSNEPSRLHLETSRRPTFSSSKERSNYLRNKGQCNLPADYSRIGCEDRGAAIGLCPGAMLTREIGDDGT
jgi:hypothetical protein